MATHKVPQDVEAEDKLLGPLSLKQLIFTILGIGFGYLTYFFFVNVHPISSIIWLPFTLLFLVLGLYQRKDQPVEVFLAAAARYHIKPRIRLWNQEGFQERVIVTAPVKIEHQYTKNITGEEAFSRLDSLSNMMDSRGWSAKLMDDWQNPRLATAAASNRLATPSISMPLSRSSQPVDIQDQQTSPVSRAIEQKIDQSATTSKQHALQSLQRARNEVLLGVDPPESADLTPAVTTATDPTNTALAPTNVVLTTPIPQLADPDSLTTNQEDSLLAPLEKTLESVTSSASIDYRADNLAPKTDDSGSISSLDDGSIEISLHH